MTVTPEDEQRLELLAHRVEAIRTALSYAELREDVRGVLEQHLAAAEQALADAHEYVRGRSTAA